MLADSLNYFLLTWVLLPFWAIRKSWKEYNWTKQWNLCFVLPAVNLIPLSANPLYTSLCSSFLNLCLYSSICFPVYCCSVVIVPLSLLLIYSIIICFYISLDKVNSSALYHPPFFIHQATYIRRPTSGLGCIAQYECIIYLVLLSIFLSSC